MKANTSKANRFTVLLILFLTILQPLYLSNCVQLNQQPAITILHFNDAYDIQPNKKGLGGVVNFQAFLREYKQNHLNTILLFSGDSLSPSIYTNIFRGEQMAKCLTFLGIDAAVYGNHEFDLTKEQLKKCIQMTNFPWLLGNIKLQIGNQLVSYANPYHIKIVNGLKIGIFGVVGDDFLQSLADQTTNFIYQDYLQYSKKASSQLKNVYKCDIIIALSHMRLSNDLNLAKNQQSYIDLILGAHDHIVYKGLTNQVFVVKSGFNFMQVGIIKVFQKMPFKKVSETEQNQIFQGRRYYFSCQIVSVPLASQEKINIQLKSYVDLMVEKYKGQEKKLGCTYVDLDLRDQTIRTQQTNYGNWFTDVIRLYHNTEIAFLNSGKISLNSQIPVGDLDYSRISDIIQDEVVIKFIPGKAIKLMLQNSISVHRNEKQLKGRFLQISGIKYQFFISEVPTLSKVIVGDKLIQDDTLYSVAMTAYMAKGGDGYDFIQQYQTLVDQVEGVNLLNFLLMNFFQQKVDLKQKKQNLQTIYNSKPLRRSDCGQLSECKKMFHSQKTMKRTQILISGTQQLNGKQFNCISPIKEDRIKKITTPPQQYL